ILASLDHLVHNGWSMDYQGLPPTDIHLAVLPDVGVAGLLPLLKPREPGWRDRPDASLQAPDLGDHDKITPLGLAAALREAVVSNNNSFFNDELHQDRMARQRNRPVANRWIGQRIADPEPDLGLLAKAQGGEGFGPIRRPDELPRALRAAIDCVEGGGVAVVD